MTCLGGALGMMGVVWCGAWKRVYCVCVHVCTCVYEFMHVCIYVCMCVYMCV